MGGAKKSTWVGATIFAAVVILVATYFLAVSPTLASADDLRAQADQTNQQNDLLQMQVTKLAADFKKLPEYKKQLAAIQTQMPADPELADFLRQLDTIATAHKVTLVTITPSAPQAVSIASVAPKAATPATDDTSVDGTATEPSPSPTPSAATGTSAAKGSGTGAATTPDGFESVSFSIEVLGSYDDTEAFVHDLQNKMPRIFLVSGLTGQSTDKAAAGGGHPATEVGDQQLQITGLTYVLPDALATPAPAPTATAPPALPAPKGDRDPLVPIVKQ